MKMFHLDATYIHYTKTFKIALTNLNYDSSFQEYLLRIPKII